MERYVPPSRRVFYVYEHWRPDKNVCFWVGKGKGARAYDFKRNSFYNRVVNKLARIGMCVEVRLVANGLLEQEAFTIEKERIAFWRSTGIKLCNVTDGGEGPSGFKPTRASIEKGAAKKRGRKLSPEHRANIGAGHLGKTHTEQHRKNLSKAKLGVPQKPHTEEHNINIGNALRGKHLSETACENIRRYQSSRPESHNQAISKALTGRKLSEEHCANLTKSALKRAPTSEEACANMRASQQKRRAENPVKEETKARASASITLWHARRRELKIPYSKHKKRHVVTHYPKNRRSRVPTIMAYNLAFELA